MKTLNVVALTMVSLVAGLSWAQENDQLTGTLKLGVTSQYVLPEGVVVDKKPIAESQLTLRYGDDVSGWYTSLWFGSALTESKSKPAEAESAESPSSAASGSETAQPTSTLETVAKSCSDIAAALKQFKAATSLPALPEFEREVDWTVGYDHAFKHWSLDLSATYCNLGDLGKVDDDQWSVDTKATLTSWPVKPYLWLRYLGEFSQASPKGGFSGIIGATRKQSLGFCLPGNTEKQTLDLDGCLVFTNGALDLKPGFACGRITASTDIKMTKHSFLTPSVTWQTGSSKATDAFVGSLKWRVEL